LKYIEFGYGNRWLLRTETEFPDGTEQEQRGIARPIKPQSIYVRLWLGRTVLIMDSRQGFKRSRKNRRAFKIILGICSH